MPGTYDDGEAFDATDYDADYVPPGTAAILYAEQLEHLREAGF